MTAISSLSPGLEHLFRCEGEAYHQPRTYVWAFDLGMAAEAPDQMPAHPETETFAFLHMAGCRRHLVEQRRHFLRKPWTLIRYDDLQRLGQARRSDADLPAER